MKDGTIFIAPYEKSKKCSVETLNKLPLSRNPYKKPFLKKRFFYVPICYLYLSQAEKNHFQSDFMK